MIAVLHLKLLRNLWELRGQGLAIAAVIAAGVAMSIMSFTVLDALTSTRDELYESYQFADVFADLRRAPRSVIYQIKQIDGVKTVSARIKAPANIRVPGFAEPVTGLALSISDGKQPQLNQVQIIEGALPEPFDAQQIVVSEAFTEAHGMRVGDTLSMLINGALEELIIVGIALSPEFIYQIQPGGLVPDYKRYCILWMNESVLESAFDMDAAFNSVSIKLASPGDDNRVIERLDQVLANWGGLGAYRRHIQLSHQYLRQEIEQLNVMATVLPAIFLGVAAFLLSIVASRLISSQRDQIAILKAFGYSNTQIGFHYSALVICIVCIGDIAGMIGGRFLAEALGGLYQEYYRFPYLLIELQPSLVIKVAAMTVVAGLLGALNAIHLAVTLPPAEAMRPEPPGNYKKTLIERLGFNKINQLVRMILRNIERKWLKSLLSIVGIAMSVAILMVSGFQEDAVKHMMNVQFNLSQKQTASIQFFESTSDRAQYELASIEGVYFVEPFRQAPVKLSNKQYSYRTGISAYPAGSQLNTILDNKLNPVSIEHGGLYLSAFLADLLRVSAGDLVQVEFLDGTLKTVAIPVAQPIEDFVGLQATMSLKTFAKYAPDAQSIDGALIGAHEHQTKDIKQKLLDVPSVAGVTFKRDLLDSFKNAMDETILAFSLFSIVLAGIIAFAVVHNNARIAFAERSRELASLRVLGFTRFEVASILNGEVVILTLVAIPVGFVIGSMLCWMMSEALQTDIYRIPFILLPSSYATAASVILVATLMSMVIMSKKLKSLDMLSALKAIE